MELNLMDIANDPRKMNALLELFGAMEKLGKVNIDLNIWINGEKKIELQNIMESAKQIFGE